MPNYTQNTVVSPAVFEGRHPFWDLPLVLYYNFVGDPQRWITRFPMGDSEHVVGDEADRTVPHRWDADNEQQIRDEHPGGPFIDESFGGTNLVVEEDGGARVKGVPGIVSGGIGLSLATGAVVQAASVSFGDNFGVPATFGPTLTVSGRVPTLLGGSTRAEMFIGLTSKVSAVTSVTFTPSKLAGFTIAPNGAITCVSQDQTTTTSTASGRTLTADDQWRVFVVDMTDLNNILAFIDGYWVAGTTQFDGTEMSATDYMQPLLQVSKAHYHGTQVPGAGLGELRIRDMRLSGRLVST